MRKTNTIISKQLKIAFVLFAFLFSVVQPVQGQKFLKKLKDKVKKETEEIIENKSEEKEDEAKEEAGGLFDLSGTMGNMGFSGDPVPIEDNYQFTNLIEMHLENYDENGKKTSDSDFITHFDADSKSMAYQAISGEVAEQNKAIFIIDAQNEATIMLMNDDGDKTGVVYGMKSFLQMQGEEIENEQETLAETPETYLANPNITKTGKTKKIAGFECEEYIYEDETSKSDMWITDDLKLNATDFMSTLFKTSIASNGMGWGYLMESTVEDKESHTKTFMQVTKVDDNSNQKFNLKEYEITNMGSFTPPGIE